MGEGRPITTIAPLPLCYPSNTGPFLLRGHFVVPVPPPFTNFLVSEIRAKTFDGGIVRTGGRRPAVMPGFLFATFLIGPGRTEARQRPSLPRPPRSPAAQLSLQAPEARCLPGFSFLEAQTEATPSQV